MTIKLLDCTFRDGGYYNSWDFPHELIDEYFTSMEAISADYVEIGFRTLKTHVYKGGCGFSTDEYIRSLNISQTVKLAVMINAGELIKYPDGVISALRKLFTPAENSPVSLVRIACHMLEIKGVLPGISWLKEKGYNVAINFMQIADRSIKEIHKIAKLVSDYPLDILYFADSMGSLNPEQVKSIVRELRVNWKGDIGIHTHDNMCMALENSLRAIDEGVTWVDGTVTGMGRGPGNAKIEYLAIEMDQYRKAYCNPTKLFSLIEKYFKPLQQKYQWGANPFYYLSGKYGIHPTYIQEMLGDSRYETEDILAVINFLKKDGGKKFSLSTIEGARQFYVGKPMGSWIPMKSIRGKDVLILGSGPGVFEHKRAIEMFIRLNSPFVIALNTSLSVAPELIDVRAACHPIRLMADAKEYKNLSQPLATPASQLPQTVIEELGQKEVLDFGIIVKEGVFAFFEKHCILPSSLVVAYALAIATSGKANCIFLAGFDGYGADDPRTIEMNDLFAIYEKAERKLDIFAITPSKYKVQVKSVYAL